MKRVTGKSMMALVMVLVLMGWWPPAGQAVAADQPSPVKISIQKLSNGIFYPVVRSGIDQESIRKNINKAFLEHADAIWRKDQAYRKQYEKDKLTGIPGPYYASTRPYVRFNDGRLLSVSFVDEAYTGGAHGMHYEKTYNFKTDTGEQLQLGDVVTNQTQLDQVNDYVKNQMIELKKAGRYDFFIDSFKGIDQKEGQFYFDRDGITLVFQEYEVAPYSNGIIHIHVPREVFK
ncbi:DUF3298 and DUF4163 domain-containing protein [Sporolactobacillus sp. Y61]|uniref:DUF3298 and DUF4163 domain-containing protein n=1 Tax=Sporolactobacillus sp. Y61 TaxID=3160863 RepID=A0AAU8IFD4_9BACL